MDIYIALVVSAIFILQAYREYRAAERRRKIKEQLIPMIVGFIDGLEGPAKGDPNEQGTDPG